MCSFAAADTLVTLVLVLEWVLFMEIAYKCVDSVYRALVEPFQFFHQNSVGLFPLTLTDIASVILPRFFRICIPVATSWHSVALKHESNSVP